MADADPAEAGGEPAAAGDEPAVDASRADPHARARVTAADRETADRLAALEHAGAVEGYAPRIDYDALGLRTAVLRIDAHHGNASAVADDLREGPGVAVYRTAGRFDVVAVCRFSGPAAFERAVARLASDPRVRAHRAAVARHAVAEDDWLAAVTDGD